ncbi:MAG: TIGR03557 family F420-dependent LLM class oxidoreductase [Candidatus Bathyarchaeota archaeon]|nr:TIGR03557 family F420-dependent LLM class oxidoreductase [Candidatus Bathyarchaeota archaeon]
MNTDKSRIEIGYSLMSEEHPPLALVKYAALAEQSGFSFATISDHYHPWISKQGQAPFVWSTLGAISQVTSTLKIGTAVTCPTIRMHPAIVAHAAATSASLMPNRFFLGVGTGENLNEHIVGEGWPSHAVRREMLKEAVEIIRELWTGEKTSYFGAFYTVENAKLYTLPPEPVPIIVSVVGKEIAKLASEIGDGMISTEPNREYIDIFLSNRTDAEAPLYCQATVCYAPTEEQARDIVFKQWPNSGLPGDLSWETYSTELIEAEVKLVTKQQASEHIACGPDPAKHLETIQKYIDAGFDKVSIHNVGPYQEEFFRFYKEHVIPKIMGDRKLR